MIDLSKNIKRLAFGTAFAAIASAQGGRIKEVHTFDAPPIDRFVNTYIPSAITTSYGFKLGGIGSGLWTGPGDQKGIYWMITDRGPNPQTSVRAWPFLKFSPFILKVKASGGTIEVLEAMPLTDSTGEVVTGLNNEFRSAALSTYPQALGDERMAACPGITGTITPNPNGLDPEDIVRDVFGNFWTVEEHGPSIVKIAANGQVLTRYVPVSRGSVSGKPGSFEVKESLPEIFKRRPRNRGFEGVAITPDNQGLVTAIQSPIVQWDTVSPDPSRVIRILKFSTTEEKAVGEYVYVMQSVDEFGPSPKNPTEMKISAITALDQHRFLVLERTDRRAKIYKIDLRTGTNILGTKWDDLYATPPAPPEHSLEYLARYGTPLTDDLEANGVIAVEKELVIDLGTIPGVPDKIEGLTVLNGKTIAVSNDNDFQVVVPSSTDCVPGGDGVSKIFVIELDKPIK